MRILLLGKSGQLGRELQTPLSALGELVALDRNSLDLCGDLSSLAGLAQTVRAVQPDVIVNAAAYTAVDQAEQNAGLAHTINAAAPGVLAEEAARLGALLVHYSTDYVFDGSGERAWREDDATAPLNVYGCSKRDGEHLITRSGAHHLMLRTSWVYAREGQNFLRTMLRLGAERESLRVVDDQIGAPTGADWLAATTAALIPRMLAGEGRCSGLYHCVPSGHVSWYHYARFLFDTARALGAELAVRQLLPASSADYAAPAQRPLNSRLDTTRLSSTFGMPLPPWQEGVVGALQQLLARPT